MHPSQWWLLDVIWPRSIASDLRNSTQHLRSLRFFRLTCNNHYYQAFPPSSSPFLLSWRSPFSDLPIRAVDPSLRGGKYVTDATLTPNQDYYWTGGPGRSRGITTFSGNLEICSSNPGGGNLLTTHPSHRLLSTYPSIYSARRGTSSGPHFLYYILNDRLNAPSSENISLYCTKQMPS
jgi:hypothetical protein